jgi:hypothetical protein
MNFERGKDPRKSIGIGKESILKEIGGIILSGEEAKEWMDTRKKRLESSWYAADQDKEVEYNVIIEVENERYEVLKNLIKDDKFIKDGEITKLKGLESELFSLLKKLLEDFRKYGIRDIFGFPKFQKIATRTIGIDLLPVQPMTAPKGMVRYLDYKFGTKNSKGKKK